jgi:hypothetical protein
MRYIKSSFYHKFVFSITGEPDMTIYIWEEYLYILLISTAIVPILIAVKDWNYLSAKEKWAVSFLFAILLHEILGEITMRLHIRNHFLYYFQTLAVLASVAGVYYDILPNRSIIWISLTLSLGVFIEVFLCVGFNNINSVTLTISRLLPVLCAFMSFSRIFSAKPIRYNETKSLIYLHLGFLIFGSLTAINTYFKKYFIETSLDLYYLFDLISAMASAISFILFSVCFLEKKKELTKTRA